MTSGVVDLTVEAVWEAIEAVRAGDESLCWFAGERPEELVEAAESALGVALPDGYRLFVRELGAGSVGAEEVFGVTSAEFVDSSVPNGVWLTLTARREWGLSESMVVIYFDGGVDYYVLDCCQHEPQVLMWRPGVSVSGDDLPVVAEDFGTFLLGLVRAELGLG